MNELKNYTSADVIDALPFFEFADREKRLPKFMKWRMLKIVGFELYDKKLMRLVPDEDEMGINAEQLNKLIPIEEMLEKVPVEIQRKGGWAVFDNQFIKRFITHQEHVDNYRRIPDMMEQCVKNIRKYEITKISKREDGWIIKTGDTQWFFINPIFNMLRPRVKDWLVITGERQYGIVRNPDAVDYVPVRYRDNKKEEEIDEDAKAHQKPVKREWKPKEHRVAQSPEEIAKEQLEAGRAMAMAEEKLPAPPEEILVQEEACEEECNCCEMVEVEGEVSSAIDPVALEAAFNKIKNDLLDPAA